jgi:hypothetical protein
MLRSDQRRFKTKRGCTSAEPSPLLLLPLHENSWECTLGSLFSHDHLGHFFRRAIWRVSNTLPDCPLLRFQRDDLQYLPIGELVGDLDMARVKWCSAIPCVSHGQCKSQISISLTASIIVENPSGRAVSRRFSLKSEALIGAC